MQCSQNIEVWVSFSVWILPAPCTLLVLHMLKTKIKCYLMFCFDKLFLFPLFIIGNQFSSWSCPIASGYLSQCYSASEIFLPQIFYNCISGFIGHGGVRNGCVGHQACLLFVSACHGFSTKKKSNPKHLLVGFTFTELPFICGFMEISSLSKQLPVACSSGLQLAVFMLLMKICWCFSCLSGIDGLYVLLAMMF